MRLIIHIKHIAEVFEIGVVLPRSAVGQLCTGKKQPAVDY